MYVFRFGFFLNYAHAVTVCGRGYIKTVYLHQGASQANNRDNRNLAVEFDTTGFNTSDFPSASHYWRPGGGSRQFLTADLVGPKEPAEFKYDSLYQSLLQTVNNAQAMRLPVVMYHDESTSSNECRRYVAQWLVKVCTSEADCTP